VYYTGVDDTRTCPEDCPCTTSGVFECKAFVYSYASSTCSGPSTPNEVLTGAFKCLGSTAGAELHSFAVDKVGACTPGTATGSGEATPKNPWTVCCAE
jgi:hypothetical protein